GIESLEEADEYVRQQAGLNKEEFELNRYISELEYEMELAARNLQFEKAAELRDRIKEYKKVKV
ncbi:MAG: UvrB/UvrC motif-containing protein, partial [Candidatus Omnitrophica bacterium]|nr:UvrB/UvrC motif-containing protein [Candidatus Omnitrophota bacterium]